MSETLADLANPIQRLCSGHSADNTLANKSTHTSVILQTGHWHTQYESSSQLMSSFWNLIRYDTCVQPHVHQRIHLWPDAPVLNTTAHIVLGIIQQTPLMPVSAPFRGSPFL